MRHERDLKPAQRARRQRRTEALIRFHRLLEKPFHPVPIRETECERNVRRLEEIVERFKLAEAAGMIPADHQVRMYWMLCEFEQKLTIARRELRFERGDF